MYLCNVHRFYSDKHGFFGILDSLPNNQSEFAAIPIDRHNINHNNSDTVYSHGSFYLLSFTEWLIIKIEKL